MPINRKSIHDSVFLASLVAIAFFLPVFGRVIPTIIAVMILNWIIGLDHKHFFTDIIRDRRRRLLIGFASLYLLYLAGMIYSTNTEYGWFDLEIKLSILIFPMVFATTRTELFSAKNLDRVFYGFIAGCVTGSVIMLVHAAIGALGYRIPGYHIPGSFYYMKLSWYSHASYLAMYFNFAIAVLFWYLTEGLIRGRLARALMTGIIFLLAAMIILLSSKAGMILLVAVVLYFALRSFLTHKKFRMGAIILGAGLVSLVMAYYLFPFSFSRISKAGKVITSEQQVHRTKSESNADRIAIFKTGIGILKDHYLIGVGTGDVKDALLEGYRRNDVGAALKLRLNAHNQYLQTFIALGIPGLLLLIFLIAAPAVVALKNNQVLYMVFLVLAGLNLLFESMLEVQAGVVFYAFFNALLFAVTRFNPTGPSGQND